MSRNLTHWRSSIEIISFSFRKPPMESPVRKERSISSLYFHSHNTFSCFSLLYPLLNQYDHVPKEITKGIGSTPIRVSLSPSCFKDAFPFIMISPFTNCSLSMYTEYSNNKAGFSYLSPHEIQSQMKRYGLPYPDRECVGSLPEASCRLSTKKSNQQHNISGLAS